MIIVTDNLNLWFLDKHVDDFITPSIEECRDMLKAAMIEDHYWQDGELEDKDIEGVGPFYQVENSLGDMIREAHDNKLSAYSDDQLLGSVQAFISIISLNALSEIGG